MKVLIIPSWYPEGEDKLMGIYHKEYTEALAKNGVDVDMLFVKRERLRNPLKYLFMKKCEIIQENGYKLYKIRMLDFESVCLKFHMCLYTKKLFKIYKTYLKENKKPDILHAQVTIPAGYAVKKLGEKIDVPVIITEHSSHFTKYFEGKYKDYGLYAIKNTKFTTVSNLMKKQVENEIKEIDILPNLVDTEIFKKEKYKRDNNKVNLITVSAFRIGKGIEDIIKALNILVNDKKQSNIHLSIVGDGYNRDFYEKTAQELNLTKYITFHGVKSKSEIAELLSKNDIFIVGSHYESFCIPGIEALASGTPIVSTKCHGPEEYLDKKCGEFCEVKNPEDMAEKILIAIKNIDKYDMEHMRNIADKYSAKEISKKAIAIYKKMINE